MSNIGRLSSFTIASLVLAIIASVLTVAEVFYTYKNPMKFKGTYTKFAITTIVPSVTFGLWILTILSATNGYCNQPALAVMIAVASTILFGAFIFGLALLISNNVKTKDDEPEKNVDEELETLKGLIADVIENEEDDECDCDECECDECDCEECECDECACNETESCDVVAQAIKDLEAEETQEAVETENVEEAEEVETEETETEEETTEEETTEEETTEEVTNEEVAEDEVAEEEVTEEVEAEEVETLDEKEKFLSELENILDEIESEASDEDDE